MLFHFPNGHPSSFTNNFQPMLFSQSEELFSGCKIEKCRIVSFPHFMVYGLLRLTGILVPDYCLCLCHNLHTTSLSLYCHWGKKKNLKGKQIGKPLQNLRGSNLLRSPYNPFLIFFQFKSLLFLSHSTISLNAKKWDFCTEPWDHRLS